MTLRKITLWLVIAIAVIVALLGLTIFNGSSNPNFNDTDVKTDNDYITAQTPLRQEIYYNGCQHLVASDQTGNTAYSEHSFAELTAAGWEVFWGEGGQAVIFREQDGLCPNDQEKFWLGAYEGRVAIFSGPLGDNSQPVEVTDIYLDDLYPEIRDKISEEGMEFPSRDELNSALENLE